jgi:uncharacterized protein
METKSITIDGIPALLWGGDSPEVFIAVHGRMSSKTDIPIAMLAEEAVPLGYQVLSFDLPEHGDRTDDPTLCKIQPCVSDLKKVFAYASARASSIRLWANSMGAYFCLLAYQEEAIEQSLFLSPVVDMKRLLQQMMTWFGVTEEQLYREQEISTPIGQKLYGDDYRYVVENPIMKWNAPTSILYGKKDELCEEEVLVSFCRSFSSTLAISEHSEHYFHTAEDLTMYREWLRTKLREQA